MDKERPAVLILVCFQCYLQVLLDLGKLLLDTLSHLLLSQQFAWVTLFALVATGH
jgi:hypothetical protein